MELRYTRDQMMAMIRAGILPEDATIELLDGQLAYKDRADAGGDPMAVGKRHRKCVQKLAALARSIDAPARHVESQQPLACSPTHTPEPDFMVVRGTIDDYDDVATAGDAFCVVEVADSSLERDLGMKLRASARAGVPQYVVVNLRNETALVHTDPDRAAGTYPPPTVLKADDVLRLRIGSAGETFDVRVADVLK